MTSGAAGQGRMDLAYDARGLPVRVDTIDPATGARWSTERRYDGDASLTGVTTTAPDGTRQSAAFVWDANRAVPELATLDNASGTTSFLHGPRRAMALRPSGAAAFSYDAHGSTRAEGPAADLARSSRYDAFGRPLPADPGAPLLDELLALLGEPSKVHAPTFGFRGELTLDGLVHLRAREYAPALARFTTTDPVDGVDGDVGVANRYHYAGNDPVNRSDPSGESWVSDGGLTSPTLLGRRGPQCASLSILGLAGPCIKTPSPFDPGGKPRPPAPPGTGGSTAVKPLGVLATLAAACLATAECREPTRRGSPARCAALNLTPPFSGGPGQWEFKKRGLVGALYEARVTGAPMGCEYFLNGYYFDGFLMPGYERPQVLIEAKSGPGAPKLADGRFMFGMPEGHKAQAQNQVGAARPTGLPILWAFEYVNHKIAFDVAIAGSPAAAVIFTRHIP